MTAQLLARPDSPFTWLDLTNSNPAELRIVAEQYARPEALALGCLEPPAPAQVRSHAASRLFSRGCWSRPKTTRPTPSRSSVPGLPFFQRRPRHRPRPLDGPGRFVLDFAHGRINEKPS